MADADHVALLREDVTAWNQWRTDHPEIRPNLKGADLRGALLSEALPEPDAGDPSSVSMVSTSDTSDTTATEVHRLATGLTFSLIPAVRPNLKGADLQHANLSEARLIGADLRGADLFDANLDGANLRRADLVSADVRWGRLFRADLRRAQLMRADLSWAKLSRADLRRAHLVEANLLHAYAIGANLEGANLRDANLKWANLDGANLCEVDLNGAQLVATNLSRATLTVCLIYGISIWDVRLEEAVQTGLRIVPPGKVEITVDDLEVAQFLYLLLHNAKIRKAIDTLTSKMVLILGRFTQERKAVLDALRNTLRSRNYIPVLFDFEGPESASTTEMVTLLARMARFVIADLTDPASVPYELAKIVPDAHVPVQALLLEGASTFSMATDLWRLHPHLMLPLCRYPTLAELLATLNERVIAPAEAKAQELQRLRSQPLSGLP